MGELDNQNHVKSHGKSFFKRRLFLILAVLLFVILASVTAVYSKVSNSSGSCASCHVIEPYYQSWKEGNLLAAKHAIIGNECINCHQQSIADKVKEHTAYVTGNYENPLKERDFPREKCLSCHQQNWQDIVAATDFEMSNPHNSHLGEIDCSLCHKMHKKSEVYCAQCHEHDWFNKLDDSWNVETR